MIVISIPQNLPQVPLPLPLPLPQNLLPSAQAASSKRPARPTGIAAMITRAVGRFVRRRTGRTALWTKIAMTIILAVRALQFILVLFSGVEIMYLFHYSLNKVQSQRQMVFAPKFYIKIILNRGGILIRLTNLGAYSMSHNLSTS